jgi:hypothetical protein
MKVRWLLPVVWVVVLFTTIGISQAAGWWATSGRQDVTTGSLGVEDLLGWMTVQQAADGLDVPVQVVVETIGGEPGAVLPGSTFKDVEAVVPGFNLDTLKEALRLRLSPTSSAAPSSAPASSTPPSSASATHQPQPSGSGTGAGGSTVSGQQTLRQVAEAYKLDLARLIVEAGLPAEVNPDVALRTLRDTVAGFEMQQVRDAVERLR